MCSDTHSKLKDPSIASVIVPAIVIMLVFVVPVIGGLKLVGAVLLAMLSFNEVIEIEGLRRCFLPRHSIELIPVGIIIGAARDVEDLRHEHQPEHQPSDITGQADIDFRVKSVLGHP